MYKSHPCGWLLGLSRHESDDVRVVLEEFINTAVALCHTLEGDAVVVGLARSIRGVVAQFMSRVIPLRVLDFRGRFPVRMRRVNALRLQHVGERDLVFADFEVFDDVMTVVRLVGFGISSLTWNLRHAALSSKVS